MLFNSIDFAIFLPIVFILYWYVFNKNLNIQNSFITVASYLFYGWWDWRFLILIGFSTVLDFMIGLQIRKSNKVSIRKLLLTVSLFVNLGFLAFFKYYNFFIESLIDSFTFFGTHLNINSLNIILPVGISFYTFQTLSYSIDIYRKKIEPTSNFITFSAFVCFFPQLVAGPIERASNLIPQFKNNRVFKYTDAVDGLRQILWGLFKKMVIADNAAEIANEVFNHSDQYSGGALYIGAFFFAFQIYGDFSGYSDIAIGTSRLFGFNLMKNFSFPYFSRDIAEFWRRWHISLSTWFRDYLYIPLGGNKGSTLKKVRNIFIIFIVSGFWHGANWTFIIWGAINAIYFLPLMFFNKNKNNVEIVANGKITPSLNDIISMFFTFNIVVITWIFFRASSASQAFNIINSLFSKSFFNAVPIELLKQSSIIFILIIIFMAFEWFGRENEYAIEKTGLRWKKYYRLSLYSFLIVIIGLFMKTNETPFIYFQF